MDPNALARECYEEADHDRERAAKLMRRRLDDDGDLYRAVAEPLIDGAVWALIRGCARQYRQSIQGSLGAQSAPTPAAREAGERVRDVAVRSWYAYPLHCGVALGDATQAQVLESMDRHARFASANGAKAAWLDAVARGMKPGGGCRVRKVYSEKRLGEMFQAACGDQED